MCSCTRYYGVAHHSLPDYIAQISGQGPSDQTQADCPDYTEFVRTGTGAFDQALGDGCVYPASVPTIADQLDAAGLTWKAYQEGHRQLDDARRRACRRPKLGAADPTFEARRGDQYATRHNPFMYFHSVIDSPTCAAKVVGLDALTRDLATRCDHARARRTSRRISATTVTTTRVSTADRVGWSPPTSGCECGCRRSCTSPAFRQDGMLVITFDEAEHDAARVSRDRPRRRTSNVPGSRDRVAAASARSCCHRSSTPGSTSRVAYNHYSLLCSIEDAFGLEHLGYAAQPGLACFGADVYGRGQAAP